MAKYVGKIGYAVPRMAASDVWVDDIRERTVKGTLLSNRKRTEAGSWLNDDINVDNEISIVADPIIKENFHSLRYVTYLGGKWKISSVQVSWPRLILTIGGVYNGPTPSPSKQDP